MKDLLQYDGKSHNFHTNISVLTEGMAIGTAFGLSLGFLGPPTTSSSLKCRLHTKKFPAVSLLRACFQQDKSC